MVLSKCSTRHSIQPMVSIYMPLAVSHLPSNVGSNSSLLEEVKMLAVRMGGRRNASCRFLKSGISETVYKSTNTVVRRGVTQIPRCKEIPRSLLCLLDSGKLQGLKFCHYIYACSVLSS